MRIPFVFFLALLTISVLAQTGATTQQQQDLLGTWKSASADDPMILTLKSDSTGELDGEAIKFNVKGDKFMITIVDEGETHTYRYKLQGNSLTISGGDLEAPMTFTKHETKN